MNKPNSHFPSWVCCQIGAREHYAVPRALQLAGRSLLLCTDFWAGPVTRRLAVGKLRSLGARWHPGLEPSNGTAIKSWNFKALIWEKRLRKMAAKQTSYDGYAEVGRLFASRVLASLKTGPPLKSDSMFFAYDTGALEAMAWCRERGLKCVLNQMDPNRVEVELVQAEEKKWPGWALRELSVPEAYFARREQEWALADRVVVNSEFSRRALIQQGMPADKLVVVPLCYEADEPKRKTESGKRKADGPLRVLFLGQVILRKGIQYLLAAARELERENIQFGVVGPIGISQKALASAPDNVTFHGRTGRDQAAEWYRKSHLFVLPTLSDGFAITQLEAMAHGLPVIATTSCGEVVSDGVDGVIVPPSDAGALAQAFRRYLADSEMLAAQSAAAWQKAGQFTLERLAASLTGLEGRI